MPTLLFRHVLSLSASWLRRLRVESGAAAVLFAATLLPIVGISSLSVDVANVFLDRREQQNAVDAASLAAASYLPTTSTSVLNSATSAAIEFAAANGVTISASDVTYSTSSQRFDVVTVRSERTVPFFFAGAMGITSGAVSSRGASQLGSLVGMTGVMPWGLHQQTFNFSAPYCLKMGSNGNGADCNQQSSAGDFGPIDIDNNGSASGNLYQGLIITGSQTEVLVGQVKGTVSGNKQGPTESALGCSNNSNGRLTGNTQTFTDVLRANADGVTYTVLDWSSPRLVIIPVIQTVGNNLIQIKGLVVFFITECGQNGSVIGQFIDTVVPGGRWGVYQPGFGTRAIRMIE
ncbi:MAG: pilus assembly protein TadG-related protein [Dehalococcoidia bacterium]